MSTDVLAETDFPPDLRERTGKVYISAPRTIDLEPLRMALRQNGFQPISLEDVPVGGSPADLIREAAIESDFVVAVLDEEVNRNVMYEIGLAHGLNKPVMLFALPGSTLPWDIAKYSFYSGPLNDATRLSERIGEVKRGILQSKPQPPLLPSSQPLGEEAEQYRQRIVGPSADGTVEQVMADLMTELGLNYAVRDRAAGAEIDMAVWSGEWEPWVSNPLALEFKGPLAEPEVGTQVRQFAEQIADRNVGWGLLLASSIPDEAVRAVRTAAPYVLLLTYDELFNRLKTESFPRIVISLRNQRVHGRG